MGTSSRKNEMGGQGEMQTELSTKVGIGVAWLPSLNEAMSTAGPLSSANDHGSADNCRAFYSKTGILLTLKVLFPPRAAGPLHK